MHPDPRPVSQLPLEAVWGHWRHSKHLLDQRFGVMLRQRFIIITLTKTGLFRDKTMTHPSDQICQSPDAICL